MKFWISVVVITMVLSSIAMTTIFGFTDNYKVEIWAGILLSLYVVTKEKKIIVNVPEQKGVTASGFYKFNPDEVIDNTQNLPSVTGIEDFQLSKTQPWKDVEVGEKSLEGEDVSS